MGTTTGAADRIATGRDAEFAQALKMTPARTELRTANVTETLCFDCIRARVQTGTRKFGFVDVKGAAVKA